MTEPIDVLNMKIAELEDVIKNVLKLDVMTFITIPSNESNAKWELGYGKRDGKWGLLFRVHDASDNELETLRLSNVTKHMRLVAAAAIPALVRELERKKKAQESEIESAINRLDDYIIHLKNKGLKE